MPTDALQQTSTSVPWLSLEATHKVLVETVARIFFYVNFSLTEIGLSPEIFHMGSSDLTL